MATIPCSEFFNDDIGVIPVRLTRANPDALENRWGNFVAQQSLMPDGSDSATSNTNVAWSLWDIPTSHCAQIDDDNGDDLIVVSIRDRVYILDYTRFQDEWDYNQVAPINRMLRIGPLPSSQPALEPTELRRSRDGYRPDRQKRLREFRFDLSQPSTDPGSQVRVTVAEYENETANLRRRNFLTKLKNRVKIAVKGNAFVVTLEHAANEQFSPKLWQGMWEVLGPRIRRNFTTED